MAQTIHPPPEFINKDTPELLTREAVATRLAMSVPSVDRLIARQELRAVRIGRSVRVRAADLARFIERLAVVR